MASAPIWTGCVTNRDQLWAEASHREVAHETIWLDDVATNTVAIQAQAARLAEDPWHDKVRDYIQGLETTTIPDLFDHILYVPTERQTKSIEMRVAAILKSLGWDKQVLWDAVAKKAFKAWGTAQLKVVRIAKVVRGGRAYRTANSYYLLPPYHLTTL